MTAKLFKRDIVIFFLTLETKDKKPSLDTSVVEPKPGGFPNV